MYVGIIAIHTALVTDITIQVQSMVIVAEGTQTVNITVVAFAMTPQQLKVKDIIDVKPLPP